jgi:hypothetical protein
LPTLASNSILASNLQNNLRQAPSHRHTPYSLHVLEEFDSKCVEHDKWTSLLRPKSTLLNTGITISGKPGVFVAMVIRDGETRDAELQ